jgi:hypothetical protein
MNDCTVCGWELEENAWFCSNCGVPVHRLDAPGIPSLPAGLMPLAVDAAGAGESAVSVPVQPSRCCPACGKPLSFLGRAAGCRECVQQRDPATVLERAILRGEPLPDNALAACRGWSRLRRRAAFRHISRQWAARGTHDEAGVAALHALMLSLGLDPGEVGFEARVRLHLYADRVRRDLPLPRLELPETYAPPVERLPGELFHYVAPAVRYEPQIRTRRYVRGRRPSLPAGSGPVHVQVAGTRGDVLTEKEWKARTSGVLLITNHGIRLHTPGARPLFIPITDVTSHTRTKNRVLIHRAGRADPYVFQIPSEGPLEIVELCLNALLGR